ncbi:autotransporter outer membrane beta-barrel domain-containing protein [Candidatus Pantoea formicae]|uniref:autotransporter outer membrane beta-barrel domain-containing protein n=1 Tax=Candidatus Pantoea formicae TaxID=2608355 RepID=UPI003EDB0903
MKVNKKQLSIATSIAFILAIKTSNVYAWDNVTVFGDSLSDGGNIGRFTNNADQNLLYDEIISQRLGDNLQPSNNGGRNYAQAGATASQKVNPILNTENQLTSYLQSRGGHADSNSLYVHWVGANDIAAALKNSSQASDMIKNSSDSSVSQVKTLLNAGEGLIIVPNVPQLGMTPYIVQILLSHLDAPSMAAAFQVLNNSTTSDEASRQQTLHEAFHAAAGKMSDIPEKQEAIAQQLFDDWKKLSSQVNGLTDRYNQQQESQLEKLNGNIARMDIAGLFNEVIASPNQYGLSNTIGTACPLVHSADKCHPSDTGGGKERNYLFSDRLHPSSTVHRMMADYFQSVLLAPAQAASLSTSAQLMNTDMHSTLDGHLLQQRSKPADVGKLSLFGGYAGGRFKTNPSVWPNGKSTTTNATVGIGYQLTDSLQSGVIFSNSNQRMGLPSVYGYKFHGSLSGVYSQFSFLQDGWVNADFHYSSIDYDHIQRKIKIGRALRTEQGNTQGNQLGIRLQTGWNFPLSERVKTGPVVGYSLDETYVKGYSEIDNRSTSMHFSDQTYRSQIGSIGWRLESKQFTVNPWAQLTYSHQFGDKETSVRAGLKSTQTSFIRTFKTANKDWVDVAMGLNIPLSNNINAFAGVSTVATKADFHPITWNVGINATF